MDLSFLHDILVQVFNKELAKRLLDVTILLLAGLIVQEILLFISGRFRKRLHAEGKGSENVRAARAKTISNVLFTSISIAGWIVLLIMVLDKLGVNIAPILASAGVIGLAVSFGSQELVKDVISGFFYLLENQFNTGDIIEVKGKKGKVEDMNFRTVTLKDLEDDTVYIIRNSQIDFITRFDKKAVLEALEAKQHEKK